jgi:hypothetical protein
MGDIRSGPRYSRVPWLLDSADLREMGAPESVVNVGNQIALGLHIPHPFGRESDATLIVRAVRGNGNDGGVISLAIGAAMTFDCWPPKAPESEPMRMELLSNPFRRQFSDDNGANDPGD